MTKEKTIINFQTTKKFKEEMKDYCEKTDNNMSRLIRVAVDEYMKNHQVDED